MIIVWYSILCSTSVILYTRLMEWVIVDINDCDISNVRWLCYSCQR